MMIKKIETFFGTVHYKFQNISLHACDTECTLALLCLQYNL